MQISYTILVVEDDPAIRTGLIDALNASGYKTISAGTGKEAKEIIEIEPFDLALLDVVLPDFNGFELLKFIRKITSTIPVIMITAKGAELDRVRGLKLGADDYIVKPFSLLEVLARIEAVLRRSPERPHQLSRILLNEGYIDLSTREIHFPNKTKEVLTSKEFELIRHLAEHRERIISREEILTRIWKMDPRLIETRSIDVTIARLREKLGKANATQIKTLHGQGYTFESPKS